METPSSTRRITRSQTKATFPNITNLSSKTIEESEKDSAKKSTQRTHLIDITNDSPIVGVASGNLSSTPISSFSKQKIRNHYNKTPGSGEALLRGQVKNLLQKVEEEAEISKFLSFETNGGRHGLEGFLNSPAGLLAPTPANTPQVLNFNSALDGFGLLGSVLESPIEDQLTVSKVASGIFDGNQQAESEKDIISRSLFMDFSDKLDSSPSKDDDNDEEDDDASIWSIQVNASTRDEDESKSQVAEVEELCEGMKALMGKHIRFVYNSDDELVDEEEVLRLKGLPTPIGKHLRFQDEQDD